MKTAKLVLCVIIIGLLSACGQKSNSEEKTETMVNPHADMTEEEEVVEVAETPGVFFGNIQEGQILQSPFMVEMGVVGMEVEPAGVVNEGKGHHHMIINGTFVEKGMIVPADKQHIHYGDGRTSTEITLEPGDYTLTLQFADGVHKSYGENMSATVHVTVE